MTNPETLKQILRGAKEEIEKWPEWMKDQEPVLRRQSSLTGPAQRKEEPKQKAG